MFVPAVVLVITFEQPHVVCGRLFCRGQQRPNSRHSRSGLELETIHHDDDVGAAQRTKMMTMMIPNNCHVPTGHHDEAKVLRIRFNQLVTNLNSGINSARNRAELLNGAFSFAACVAGST